MNSKAVTAQHVATASRYLAEALHYHRFFGQPIAAFSDRHNAMRREANDKRVAALAFEGGRYLRFASQSIQLPVAAAANPVTLEALNVPAIVEASVAGWNDTDALLDTAHCVKCERPIVGAACDDHATAPLCGRCCVEGGEHNEPAVQS